MRHEIKKIAKMTDEIVTFCLEQGADSVQLKIETEKEKRTIFLEVSHLKDMGKAVEKLKRRLSYPRERELEEYYWELAGECNDSKELQLVGAMIDEVIINQDEETLKIELIRFNRE